MVLLSVVLLHSVILSQNKLSIYGFLDAGFRKLNVDENNFTQMSPKANRNPQLFLGNVNLYFDFNPNEFTRSLVEVNLNSNKYDKRFVPGREITLSAEGAQKFNNMIYMGMLQRGMDEAAARDTAAELVDLAIANLRASGEEYVPTQRYGTTKLERAWCEVNANDQMNFRFGKFLTPAGIWNVDHGSPLILTINQPFQTTDIPIFPTAMTGAMFHGRVFVGDHDIDYKAYLTSGRDDSLLNNMITAKLADFGGGGHVGAHFDVIDGINVGVSGYTGKIKHTRLMMELEINDPNDIVNYDLTLDKFIYTWHEDEVSREKCLGVDAKIRFKDFTLQTEYNGRRLENTLRDDAPSEIYAYYFLGSYEVPVNRYLSFTPYVYFESVAWKNPQLNPAENLHVFPADAMKNFNCGLNTRLFTNVRLKLEYYITMFDVINSPYAMNVDPDSDNFNSLTDAQKYNSQMKNYFGKDDLNASAVSAQVTIAF